MANRINEILQLAKWKYIKPTSWVGLFGGIEGVQVWRHPEADESTREAATSLVAALAKTGVAAVLRLQNPTNNPKHNKIDINVGTKP